MNAPTVAAPQNPAINPIAYAFSMLWLYTKRPFLLRRVRRTTIERVDDVAVVVSPDILNPVVFRSGEFFARAVASEETAAPPAACAEPRLLDMGTGSGICAIFGARRGYRVTAVDLNPEAVRYARVNAMLNRLEDRIEVAQSDLFEALSGQRFDLILFNPPFFRGEPKSKFDMAWRSKDVFERFAAGLDGALTPDGRALVLLSTDGDAAGMLRALQENGFRSVPAVRRNYGNEVMTIYAVERQP